MIKILSAKIALLVLLSPLLSQAGYMVNCGGIIGNTDKEFMFQLHVGRAGQQQVIAVSAGNTEKYSSVEFLVQQSKESTGLMSHRDVIADADGRFRLERSGGGLMGAEETWKLTAKLNEIGLVMDKATIDCLGYY